MSFQEYSNIIVEFSQVCMRHGPNRRINEQIITSRYFKVLLFDLKAKERGAERFCMIMLRSNITN